MTPDLTAPHVRWNPLRGEWVLVSPRSTIVIDPSSLLSRLTRRQVLGAALATPLYRAWSPPSPSASARQPDAVCLAGDLPEHEFVCYATAIYSTGGMVLSGDDLTAMPEARMAMLRKLRSVRLFATSDVREVWSGESLGRLSSVTVSVPAHSARLVECVHV